MRLFGGYRLIDFMTQAYAALVGLLILLFHGDAFPQWHARVVIQAAILVAVHVLIRCELRSGSRFVRMLRAFYPMILFTFFYTETHVLDDLFVPGPLDGYFIDMEQRIFGAQLSRTFMAGMPWPWLSELFYMFYFSYYLMVLVVGLAIYFRRSEHFFSYITVVGFVFYVCYLTYAFLPVMGPHGTEAGVIFHGELASVGPRATPAVLTGGPFYRLMAFIYELAEPEIGGAAFPSSHVAVALTTLWFTWTHFRHWGYVHLVATVGLCLATVYCGYHYAVDVVAGILTGAVLAPLGLWLYRRSSPRGWPSQPRRGD